MHDESPLSRWRMGQHLNSALIGRQVFNELKQDKECTWIYSMYMQRGVAISSHMDPSFAYSVFYDFFPGESPVLIDRAISLLQSFNDASVTVQTKHVALTVVAWIAAESCSLEEFVSVFQGAISAMSRSFAQTRESTLLTRWANEKIAETVSPLGLRNTNTNNNFKAFMTDATTPVRPRPLSSGDAVIFDESSPETTGRPPQCGHSNSCSTVVPGCGAEVPMNSDSRLTSTLDPLESGEALMELLLRLPQFQAAIALQCLCGAEVRSSEDMLDSTATPSRARSLLGATTTCTTWAEEAEGDRLIAKLLRVASFLDVGSHVTNSGGCPLRYVSATAAQYFEVEAQHSVLSLTSSGTPIGSPKPYVVEQETNTRNTGGSVEQPPTTRNIRNSPSEDVGPSPTEHDDTSHRRGGEKGASVPSSQRYAITDDDDFSDTEATPRGKRKETTDGDVERKRRRDEAAACSCCTVS